MSRNHRLTTVGLTKQSSLSPEAADEVRALIAAAEVTDGVAPISEGVMLALAAPPQPAALHLLASAGEQIVGYAHLATAEPDAGSTAELAVLPAARYQGVGRALLAALVAAAPEVRLWAHGELSAAHALATQAGFQPNRTLWQFRRRLDGPQPRPALPASVVLRPFRPGRDESRWLELNAAALADLPDQGSWGPAELAARVATAWFDAAGFLLAEHILTGELAGFVWTKVAVPPPTGTTGELYVVGVAPQWRGRGLGRALAQAGMAHLRGLGLHTAILYVDTSNAAAVSLYESLGFQRRDSSILFRRP